MKVEIIWLLHLYCIVIFSITGVRGKTLDNPQDDLDVKTREASASPVSLFLLFLTLMLC